MRTGRERNFADKNEIIQKDAATSARDRDAPGQNCTYIPPGDHRVEFYRLGTYAQFPKNVPVKATDMAAAGFYWTGFKDRVRCFSCGMTAENWTIGDDGMDDQWHKSSCKMMSGHDLFNIPIPEPNFRSLFRLYRDNPDSDIKMTYTVNPAMDISDEMNRIRLTEPLKINFASIIDPDHDTMLKSINLRSEMERRKTFAKWPSYPAPFLVSDLAKEGFFYLGNLDRTQCFSCSGVLRNWAPTDSVKEQHTRHFGHCKICCGEPSGNIPMLATQRAELDRQYQTKMESLMANQGEPRDPSLEEQRDLEERFPCREPVNPHMTSVETRVSTFNNLWPRHKVRAPVEQIAKAGFFFLGESDKTKCFYCNGGLQNWDINDEPWTEHAKWFPGCEYILRKKGIDFVRRLRDAHPNLNRPFIRNPIPLDVPLSQIRRPSRNTSLDVPPPTPNINVAELKNMGFSKEQIDRAISRHIVENQSLDVMRNARRRGTTRYTMEDIVQDLLEHPPTEQVTQQTISHPTMNVQKHGIAVAAGNKREAAPENSVVLKKTRSSSPTSLACSGMAESLREMEEAVLCRQCKKNRSEMTMIPCGHLCLCEGCAANVKRCVICHAKVTQKIKVYRA